MYQSATAKINEIYDVDTYVRQASGSFTGKKSKK